MKNLISNTLYGVEILTRVAESLITPTEGFKLRCNFDKFLINRLELWMFVPVMSNGIIPNKEEIKSFENTPLFEEYQEAKDRVLFEGFEFIHPSFLKSKTVYIIIELRENVFEFKLLHDVNNTDSYIKIINTIEDISKLNLELTDSAQKQIGIN